MNGETLNNVPESLKEEETLSTVEVKEENIEEKKATEVKPKKIKKKRNILIRILNLLAFLLLIFVAFETVIAFLNFNLIQKNKEPEYFVTKTKEVREDYDYTIYDMGLYKIIRKEDNKNYEIKLLPFFLDM